MTTNVIPFQRPAGRIPAGPPAARAVYTVREVAYLLSLSLSTTYHLISVGEIPAERLGRRWIVPRVRFHTWLDGLVDEQDTHPAGAS